MVQSPILVKQILLLLIVVTTISCTKENLSHSVVGDWTIIERKIGTGYNMETSPILSQRILYFNPNGTFQVADDDSSDFLQPFSQYEVMQDKIIRFYNADKTLSEDVNFQLNENLSLFYTSRCGYQEVFVRK
jgi:hypothetical protein